MAATTAPTPSPSPLARRLPLFLLLLAVLLLAGARYAHLSKEDIVGPLALAASGERVAVLAPGALYHLNADGALQSVDTEHVAADARDGGLAWVGDALLVSPGAENELLACTRDACERFSDDNWAPTGPVQAWFDGTWYWLSETDADRIQRYDVDRKRVDMPVSDLSRPGSLWVDGEQLYVANAGARKVLRYRIHKRGIADPETFAEWSEGPVEDPVSIPRRLLPDGETGVKAIFANGSRTAGVVVNIDAEGTMSTMDVAGLVHPVGLARLGTDLLVLDEATMQVLRVDADGNTTVFGDDAFRAQLAERQSTREWLVMLVPGLFVLGILLLGVGGSWLIQVLTNRPDDTAINVSPDSDGIQWLPAVCDLAPRRIPRLLAVVAPVALLPAAALVLKTPWLLFGLLWATVFFSIAALVPIFTGKRTQLPKGERIGIRDRQLIVTHPEHGLREFALPRVEWNEYLLRPEPGLDIPLVRNGAPLYHPATVESLLIPKLNLMKKLEG